MLSILRSTGGDFGRCSRTFRPLSEAQARFWLHLPLQQAIKHATGYKACNGRRARCNIDRMCWAPVRDATCNIGCHAACHGRSPRKGSHASARRLASVRARVRACVRERLSRWMRARARAFWCAAPAHGWATAARTVRRCCASGRGTIRRGSCSVRHYQHTPPPPPAAPPALRRSDNASRGSRVHAGRNDRMIG